MLFHVHLLSIDLLVRRLPSDRRGCLTTMIGRLDTISLTSSGSKTRDVEGHLRNEKEYADEGQPTRNTGEPEPSPPGQQLNDVAIREDSPVRIQSVGTIYHTNANCLTGFDLCAEALSTYTNVSHVREHCKVPWSVGS